MNMENNNERLALHGMLAALIFCAAVAFVFRPAPYHVTPTAAISTPPVGCLPSATHGAPCIPFDEIQEMMKTQPDAPEVIPPNPATVDEEKI